MSKHTPGKWAVLAECLVVDETGMSVCIVKMKDRSLEEWQANARLIAQSPRMLDVLCQFRYAMDNGNARELQSALNEARAIIQEIDCGQ